MLCYNNGTDNNNRSLVATCDNNIKNEFKINLGLLALKTLSTCQSDYWFFTLRSTEISRKKKLSSHSLLSSSAFAASAFCTLPRLWN